MCVRNRVQSYADVAEIMHLIRKVLHKSKIQKFRTIHFKDVLLPYFSPQALILYVQSTVVFERKRTSATEKMGVHATNEYATNSELLDSLV